MGLLQTYDNTNKVTWQGLQIKYSCRIEQGETNDSEYTYYVYSRYATKRYSFVGMDEQTAKDCAAAKLSQYTRSYSIPKKSSSGGYVDSLITECMTDVAAVYVDGGMWNVDIAVNETDIKVSTVRYSDPAALFTAASARNYDEGTSGGPSIILNTVHRGGQGSETELEFHQSIGNFKPNNLIVQVRDSAQGEIKSYGVTYGSSTNAHVAGISPYGDKYFSVVYGNIESNVVMSPGMEEP